LVIAEHQPSSCSSAKDKVRDDAQRPFLLRVRSKAFMPQLQQTKTSHQSSSTGRRLNNSRVFYLLVEEAPLFCEFDAQKRSKKFLETDPIRLVKNMCLFIP
jgi:hypothetical protein